MVEPCGGDIVGTWKLTEGCVDLDSLQPAAQATCGDASITSATFGITGSITFAADMTYTLAETVTGVLVWDFPASCVGALTCDAFANMLFQGGSAGLSFTCVGTGACVCTEASLTTRSDNGTYGLAGSTVVATSAVSGSTGSQLYCVQGSTLHLVSTDPTMNTGPMGQATITGDTVGVRQ
jgi:hypothetical protein